jgi:hypothetical protein
MGRSPTVSVTTPDDDYRRSILMPIAIAVFQVSAQVPPLIWWNHPERILMAEDDLGCRELLA